MKNRIWAVDALRGLALLNMLAYHAMYDWVYIFGHPSGWYDIGATPCHVWQQYICWSFLLLSGYSFSLAKNPWKNGLVTAGCAAVLSAVTILFMPGEAIWFGVLHLNGWAEFLPLLPGVFVFWCGVFAARRLRPAPGAPPRALTPLCAIGRHTLPLYMLHQPVIYGALWLLHL